MELKYFTDYALRVLMYTASHPGRPIPMREIAKAYGISMEHLRKVIHQLGQHGYLSTQQGRGGGVRLGRRGSEIRVGDVVAAMEGETALVNCERQPCPLRDVCTLKHALGGAKEAFIGHLNEYTVASLIEGRGMQRQLSALANEP